ncbi:MAG TPA: iron-containing alcohol dehydrogenase [Thermoanaerobaculia bacterium]|nr:iron-containing alcohol dehydrogenase [Thermoanaerobaculia bacterium]
MVSVAAPRTRPAALDPWQVALRPSRVLFGAGRLAELGPLVAELGGRRALVVTDAGLRAAGHVAAAVGSLRDAEVDAVVFDAVEENPTTAHVEAAAAAGRRHAIDFLVGLGGGSALDCAKGANFLLTNGGRMEDYWGWNRAGRPMLPSVGVPSTAGTGSEAQSYALIARAESHLKMACGDEKARFTAVILDPLLPRTAPRAVSAVAGFDAISHAVESLVTRDASPFSRLFAREAWRLLERNYEAVVARACDDASWGEMLLGSHLAGAAIEASMLGAAHACANPLTARFGVAHGVAVALVLPAVVRLNAAVAAPLYADLIGASESVEDSSTAGGADGARSRRESAGPGRRAIDPAEVLARRLEALRDAGGLPPRLSSVGVGADALPALAADACEQWTLRHNPRELGEADLLALYRSVL